MPSIYSALVDLTRLVWFGLVLDLIRVQSPLSDIGYSIGSFVLSRIAIGIRIYLMGYLEDQKQSYFLK